MNWKIERTVLIESPYSLPDSCRYLACCLLDSILRHECPIASHALYPLALPEHVEAYAGQMGRDIGLALRDNLAELREDDECQIACVRYVDLGTAEGMKRPGEYLPDRKLEGKALDIWKAGNWPSLARLTPNFNGAGFCNSLLDPFCNILEGPRKDDCDEILRFPGLEKYLVARIRKRKRAYAAEYIFSLVGRVFLHVAPFEGDEQNPLRILMRKGPALSYSFAAHPLDSLNELQRKVIEGLRQFASYELDQL